MILCSNRPGDFGDETYTGKPMSGDDDDDNDDDVVDDDDNDESREGTLETKLAPVNQ